MNVRESSDGFRLGKQRWIIVHFTVDMPAI